MRKVFYNSIAAWLLLWLKRFETAMIFGFICTKRKRTDPLVSKEINHEAIHVEQYMEVTTVSVCLALVLSLAFSWGIWPLIIALLSYYIIYFVEAAISWSYNTIVAKLSDNALAVSYHNSMFEMEAYEHDTESDYISRRQAFCWIKYFGKV